MWFNLLKLDLSRLKENVKTVDADAKGINIQKPNKCKEKLFEIIEIMKNADEKARATLEETVKEVATWGTYENKDGEDIEFEVGPWRDEKRVFAVNAPYRYGFSISSEMEINGFKEIDEKIACQFLEKIKFILNDFEGDEYYFNVALTETVKNNKGEEIGQVRFKVSTKRLDFIKFEFQLALSRGGFSNVKIRAGGNGFADSYETFKNYHQFETYLLEEIYTTFYVPALKKIKGML